MGCIPCAITLTILLLLLTSEEEVPEYKLPYERELGPMIAVEHLRKFVVNQKSRPGFPDAWKHNHPVCMICMYQLEHVHKLVPTLETLPLPHKKTLICMDP